MRELNLSEIRDEVTPAKKKALANTSVVNPNDLVLARGQDSWTEDGREELVVSPVLVCSLLRAHNSNNKTDGREDCSFVGGDGKSVVGNPIIFGHLATKNVVIMGTDEAPLLVVSASGRQTLKASIFLTEFLAAARHFLQKCSGDEVKAQGKMMGDLAEHFEATRTERIQRTGIDFKGSDADAVVKFMSEADWLLLFKGGSKIGKPLAGQTYSAQVWMKVTHTGEKPTSRRALENAKRDNLRVSSPFHVEAQSVHKLVRSYVIDDGFTEEGALRHVRPLVTSPLAVGGSSVPDESYVEQLYHYAQLCDEAHAAVEAEQDPVKKILLFRKFSKTLFRASKEDVKRGDDSSAKLTVNKLTEDEQLAILNPPKKEKKASEKTEKPVKEPPNPTVSDTSFLPVRQFTAASQRLANTARQWDPAEYPGKRHAMTAVAAALAFLSGNDTALAEYPEIESVLRSAGVDVEVLNELSESLDDWDGKGELDLRPADQKDSADKKLMMQVSKLKDQMMAELTRANGKVKNRVEWCKAWVEARQ